LSAAPSAVIIAIVMIAANVFRRPMSFVPTESSSPIP
jgi:hypothetical protein